MYFPTSDGLFASGSHIGELILWDSLNWTIHAYEHILWEESAGEGQSEVRLTNQKQIERSIQHMSSDGEVKDTIENELVSHS